MAAHSRKKITVSILIPSLIFILFFSVMIWQKYRSSHEASVTPPSQNSEGSRTVMLFFATADGTRLARETRKIAPCDDDNDCLKSVLDELLNGPVSEFEQTIPDGTVVEAVRIERDQATIEFNRAFSDAMLSGSSAEMLAVYSVVNTVAVNFPSVHKVKINIAGNTGAVLNHLDLSDPLVPDYSLEQSPSPEQDTTSTGPSTHRKGTP